MACAGRESPVAAMKKRLSAAAKVAPLISNRCANAHPDSSPIGQDLAVLITELDNISSEEKVNTDNILLFISTREPKNLRPCINFPANPLPKTAIFIGNYCGNMRNVKMPVELVFDSF